MPPKKIKLNTDPNQRTIAFMFGNKPNEDESTDVAPKSKQNVLIDMSVHQVKNETGIDWTIMFDFDIHFIDTSSQQIDSRRDVEIESAGQSASTSRSATPMETEEDDDNEENSDSEDDIASTSTSDGQCEGLVPTKNKYFIADKMLTISSRFQGKELHFQLSPDRHYQRAS